MERIDDRSIISYDFIPESVVVGGGDFPFHETPLSILHSNSKVVCCDGAADEYIARGLTPWRIVGDGDSLSDEAKTKYSDIIRINPNQETNDQTKAIEDLLIIYERERLNSRKIDLLNLLEQSKDEEKRKLEKELSNIIIKLAKLNRSI